MESPCLTYALSYIYHTPKTKKELWAKLVMKKYPMHAITEVMAVLEQKKYIDDANFARLYFQSEIGRKGKATVVVKKKLEQRGIERHIIDTVFVELQNDLKDGVTQRIYKDIEKYKKKDLTDFDIKVKLHQKGYSIAQIKEAIEQRVIDNE